MLLQHPARHLAASSSECSARPAARLKHMVARAPSRCHTASECARAAIEWTLLGVPCSASSHRAHRKKRSLVCRSTTYTDPLPEDLQLELNPDAAAKEVTYDEATKTVRIPLAAVTDGQRRTKMVMFTCNQCGGRSARLVNPIAWEKGAVFAQCQHCEVWHTLAAHPSIIEEIRYNDPEWQQQQQQASGAAAPGDSSLQEESQESSGTVLGATAGSDGSQGEVSSAAAAAAAAAPSKELGH